MTNKLTIEHLAPYLPYGLRIQRGERNLKMNMGKGSSVHWIGISAAIDWFNSDMASKPVPVLRPLSDITKRINHNGEKLIFSNIFLSIEELTIIRRCIIMKHHLGDYLNFKTMTTMIKYHFDVFSLIQSGLAIDINSLTQNTKG